MAGLKLAPLALLAVVACQSTRLQPVQTADQTPRHDARYERGATNPLDAGRQRWLARLDRDGEIKPGALLRAKKHADRMPTLKIAGGGVRDDGGLWNWEWLGPGNIGGRVRAICFRGTEMFAGGVSGGIWRSSDLGASWLPINDFLPSLNITSIVVDPTNTSRMYAATGEGLAAFTPPGAGVFLSIDGGSNWSQLPATASWEYTNRLAIDPNDGQNLLAATNDGIYLSDDAGQTWIRTLFPLAADIKFNPSDGSKAVAGLQGGVAVYSTDGGSIWSAATFLGNPGLNQVRLGSTPDPDGDDDTLEVLSTADFAGRDKIRIGTGGALETVTITKVEDGDTLTVTDMMFAHNRGESVRSIPSGRVELAYAPSNPNIVYASMDVGSGTIWKSLDGGANFGFVNNPDNDYMGSQGWYDNVLWVAPENSQVIVVAGVTAWRSTDSGVSLTLIANGANGSAHVDFHTIVPSPTYSPLGDFRVYFGSDGGVFRAQDIHTVSATSGWTNLNNNLGVTQYYAGGAHPSGDFILGGSQDNGTSRYTPPGGPQGWTRAAGADGGFCAINPDNPQYQYAEWQGLRFMRSTNYGASFQDATNGLGDAGEGRSLFIAPFSMDPNDPEILVAGGESIWRTTNATFPGMDWSSIRPPLAPEDPPRCSAIDIADGDSELIWVAYDDGQVGRTIANTWLLVDNNASANPLPDFYITDIAINPSNHDEVFVTVGGYAFDTVFRTTDGGFNWEQRTGSGVNALPPIQVNTIRFHPRNRNWIYVGTDLGVYASQDKGASWSRVPRRGDHEGPANVEVSELFWQGDHLIAATFGRGMYRARPLSIVYVDLANSGFEDGTITNPYNTVQEGIDAAGTGTTISIEAATYNEGPLSFYKPGRVIATHGTVRIE